MDSGLRCEICLVSGNEPDTGTVFKGGYFVCNYCLKAHYNRCPVKGCFAMVPKPNFACSPGHYNKAKYFDRHKTAPYPRKRF
jgi:hypothetical protein